MLLDIDFKVMLKSIFDYVEILIMIFDFNIAEIKRLILLGNKTLNIIKHLVCIKFWNKIK